MPANVNYEYITAKGKYEAANTDEERIIGLQEMISRAPAHKGGENLRRDLSRKLAALKNKVERNAAVTKKSGHTINIKKDGAGQVCVLGLTNSGKSTFLTEYTNSKPTIASYQYTTTKPEVGMLDYGGAYIQLIELPSFLEKHELTPQIYSMIRVTDLLIIVIKDGSKEELDQVIKILEKQDVFITKQKPRIQLTKSEFLGVSFVNEQNLLIPKPQAIELLKSSGFRAQNIILNQKTTMDDLLLLINPRATFVPAIAVSMPLSKNIKSFNYRNIDVYDFTNNKEIIEHIFKLLNKVIVYTKKPRQKADKTEPLVLEKGQTVTDAAKAIHKTIYKNLKSAKVWGSTRYPGQNVAKTYKLKNRDVVEFII